MIFEINKNDLSILNNSFIDREQLEIDLHNNPFGKVIVYQENNEIIGYIYYSDIYERVEINQIEIKENHRNCGKGNFLLKKFTEIVDKNITLEVKVTNIPAIKIYKKNGFEKKAIRKGYYQGVDGILMEREYSTKTL